MKPNYYKYYPNYTLYKNDNKWKKLVDEYVTVLEYAPNMRNYWEDWKSNKISSESYRKISDLYTKMNKEYDVIQQEIYDKIKKYHT